MVDYSSAIWGYGFGRTQAELEAKRRAKKVSVRVAEPALSLEKFEVSDLEASVTVKNNDSVVAKVFDVLFLEILEPPIVINKKGLIFKKTMVKVAELISKAVRPSHVFTVLPGEDFTFSIDLAKPLEVNRDYMLELHMGKMEYCPPPSEDSDTELIRLGWAYMLKFDGKSMNKVFMMNLEQAGDFWGRKIAQAKGKRRWKNLYVTLPLQGERLPYEYF